MMSRIRSVALRICGLLVMMIPASFPFAVWVTVGWVGVIEFSLSILFSIYFAITSFVCMSIGYGMVRRTK